MNAPSQMLPGGRPDFEIGLALAGAISAGAYTAGVIDFLIQALQAWEEERGEGAPPHTVKIRTIAGASAGAITGAIGLIALSRGLQLTPFTATEKRNAHRDGPQPYQDLRCLLPILYDSWVARPRMVAAAGGEPIDFLSSEDLDDRKKKPALVQSLLNSRLLDTIRDAALGSASPHRPATFPYLSETMHLYMTVSNLRGIPFQVKFGNGLYGMQTHGDRFHYGVKGVGSAEWRYEQWLAMDPPIEIDVAALPVVPGPEAAKDWQAYGDCALASGAFPIGLAPRELTARFSDYQTRQYPLYVGLDTIKATFPSPIGLPVIPAPSNGAPTASSNDFKFLNVDGGVVNNNPFDYVQFAIMGQQDAKAASAVEADRAVIMVAPFPEPPAFLSENQPLPELVSVLKALFPTLINQARFRASELVPAVDRDDYSRFLIAPHRALTDRDERYAIACGLLGGFGGFLDEKFRAHDYQLGRRNCQRFLSTVFTLAASHRIGRLSASGDPAPQAGKPPAQVPIIPLVGNAAPEVPLPHWPRMSIADFDTLIARIGSRMDKVVPRLIEGQTANKVVRIFAAGGMFFQRSRIQEFLRQTILADLVRRNQIDGWVLPDAMIGWAENQPAPDGGRQFGADNLRAIVAELVTPTFDYRSVPSIAKATQLSPGFVTSVLEKLEAVDDEEPYCVIRAGQEQGWDLYALASRRRAAYRSWPVIGPIANWFSAPRTDLTAA